MAKTFSSKKFYGNSGTWEPEGLSDIRAQLNKELGRIEGKTIQGLVAAISFLKRDMMKTYPAVPKDTGDLRKSFFAVTSMGRVAIGDSPSFEGRFASRLAKRHSDMVGKARNRVHKRRNPYIVFGFSAYYAGYVHERVGDINWTTPGTGAKYFESALIRNKDVILQIIKDNIKLR